MTERKDVDKIISRLKTQDKAPVETSRISDIRSRVEGASANVALNFDRVSFTHTTSAMLVMVGKFYESFKPVLKHVAEFLYDFPAAQKLRRELACADLNFTVESYLVAVSTLATAAAVFFFALTGILGFLLGDTGFYVLAPLVGVCSFVAFALMGVLYPSMKASGRAKEIDRELPFALRQMATQIKSGLSFHHAIVSLSHSDYGLLSEEFRKVLRDIDSGFSSEEALRRLLYRTKSAGLRKTILQVLRALRTGGDLSKIISGIADDVSFELRMTIRDFTEKLNLVNVMYIMIAVVAPVTITILSAVVQLPLFATIVPSYLIYLAFGGITMGMVMILYMVRAMEPTA